MNAERLLALYDQVAEAPDAVNRLRHFVLDLAIRGKLIEQNPTDEPASTLLTRIANARKLAPSSGRKTKKKPADSSLTKLSFQLPDGWVSAQLDELVRVLNGRAYKKAELLNSGTPVLRVGNLFTSKHWYYSNLKLEKDKYCEAGDLIYAWSASFGPFIWHGPRVIYHYHIWKLPLFSEANLDKQFLYFFLSQKTKEIKGAGHGISMVHMTKNKMEQLVVPLPPLAEQRQIVAKVNEVMALCDQLDKARMVREKAQDQIAKASLARLSAFDTDDATFRSNSRFAVNSLPKLTARADQIKHLRQTILDLAVRGKLVKQNPDREPPIDLSPSIVQGEGGNISLPVNWCRPLLGEILAFQYGKGLKSNQRKKDGPVPVYGSNGILGYTTEPLTKRSCVIVGRKGSAGALNKCIGPSWTTDVAYYVEVPDFLDLHFLYISLSALNLDSLAKGVKPGLSRSDVYDERMSVPPLAEQHRIVAKVDKLMSLCGRLETNLSTFNASSNRLLESILHETLRNAA